MTEYWVSSAKHWCKFCQVWISGDRWNIQKHDQGRSHKERMEEYFKQKREDKRQGGLDDASLEKTLRQIEEAAVAAHADDLGGAGGGAGGGVGVPWYKSCSLAPENVLCLCPVTIFTAALSTAVLTSPRSTLRKRTLR